MSDQPEIPVVKPKDAIAFFRNKGLARSFAWQDIAKRQHDYFFTVAKMMQVSLLEEVRTIIARTLEEGVSPSQIKRDLANHLAAAGWWGKREEIDPLTGEKTIVQTGSARRVRTIVDTNLRVAYSAGRTARQERTKALLPIAVYKARLINTRPEHEAWHNTALPIDHPWWDTHTGPCDWGCQCKRITMTEGQARRRGFDWTKEPQRFPDRRHVDKRTGEVTVLERGLGVGWDYHPGKAPLEGLAPDPLFTFSKVDDTQTASAVDSAVDDFLKIFDLPDGGVFTDVSGYPLAISKRWLRGFSAKHQRASKSAALALHKPDWIGLLWIVTKDGGVKLTRRYHRTIGPANNRVTIQVDINNAFWRFRALPARLAGRSRVTIYTKS